jgi:isoaspartyl peptidase/L-asparaginase-like protein (Ntn-hydrolase superfamily)
MTSRREFLTTCALAGAGLHVAPAGADATAMAPASGPVTVSTWNFGQAANAAAWEVLAPGGAALDAVERGARQAEDDADNESVGLGGLPDRDGHVTLDACIMDHDLRAGSVCFLEGIAHPVTAARRVMERTPHVMLAGEGARRFALAEGLEPRDLLTDGARRKWQEWRREARYEPRANRERHDTLGLLARDRDGRLAGACTTSGMAFKMHGRVGDSPIIGAALYVDGAVGAATATGHGEFVMRTLGSFLVVELMRQGLAAQAACEAAIARIAGPLGDDPGEVQVGYLALDREGRIGAYAVQPGFQLAIRDEGRDVVLDAPSWFGR